MNINNDMPPDIPILFANTQTTIASDTNPQNLSSTQKSDSKTQSVEEAESKPMNVIKASSKTGNFFSKKPDINILKTVGKQKLINHVEKKFTNDKLNKLDSIKHEIPTSSSVLLASSQDLPDFVQGGPASPLTKRIDLPIAQNLPKREAQSTELLKAGKINYGETTQLSQQKSSGMIDSVTEKIPLGKTCRIMPHWWSDQKAFVGNIIETTRYFNALNLSMNQTEKHFEIFDDENTIEILKPFNGQIFVIFGCIVLAFPILLLLMFLRCMSEEEDLMEEAMFDLAEISIFCVFSVIEFYMSSGAEIRAVMDSLCIRYLERSIGINGYLKEKVYNICTNVKIEAYGFLSSGCIFLFLVFLFAIDLIILLKNAEEVESRKYLQMAACLHYDKTLKCMTESVLEGVFTESASRVKKKVNTEVKDEINVSKK